jgi:hypothetical protein
MSDADRPRPYTAWRLKAADREEDAAHTFGYYLMRHCRDEALARAGELSDQARTAVEQAVDTALHNVCDLLEGSWPLRSGSQHQVELVLGVRIRDARGEIAETVEVSPSKIDLPIGYWSWARDHNFQ